MENVLAALPDRPAFESALAAELERSRRADESFAMLLVEIDRLPAGLIGERAAGRVADALDDATRLFDVVVRFEDARFGVIVPGADVAGGVAVAERLRTLLRARSDRHVAVSVGVAQFPDHGGGADLLLRSAGIALTQAKELGGDRCAPYSFLLEELVEESDGNELDGEPPVTLAQLMDMRDADSAAHAQQVAVYAELVARALGLSPDHVARIRLAALLHDLGKAGIPNGIVGRPGPLGADESEEMRGHPEIGARLLEGSDFEDLVPWIEAHHERPDGQGYPAGLSGDEIPLEAAIIAVADAYAAMTTDRVYRPAIGDDAARAELERGAGTQFDARVVQAFLDSIA